MDAFGIPWPKVNDLLLELEGAADQADLLRRVCAELERLIPTDHSTMAYGLAPVSMLALPRAPEIQARFNARYRHMPDLSAALGSLPRVWEARRHSGMELVSDVLLPERILYTVNPVMPGKQYAVALNFTRPPKDLDVALGILEVVNQHFNLLYRLLGRSDATHSDPVPGFAERYALTRRETEVLSLVLKGYGRTPIAQRLFISPRTVEGHVAGVLLKTGTRNRRALAALAQNFPLSD